MASLQDTDITGTATVSSTLGVTGATTVGSTLGVTGTSTLGTTNMGAASSTTLGVSGTSTLGTTNMASASATSLGVSGETSMTGNFKIASGSPAQYRICRQQSGTSGLVQWVDFAVYDTNGSTRLF